MQMLNPKKGIIKTKHIIGGMFEKEPVSGDTIINNAQFPKLDF